MEKKFITRKGKSKQFPNMVYVDPVDVNAPQDYIISKKVIFDGGLHSFSIAEVNWKGGISYGMRWNMSMREKERDDKKNGLAPCYGMPFSTRTPVWFIIPHITIQEINRMIEQEKERLAKEDFYYE